MGMIISASRRTDLPALYSRWLRARFDAGFCWVPNPMVPTQVARVSLARDDVDAIVFWTRHARPCFDLLGELERRGYRYYFHYTINGYGRPTEQRSPPIHVATRTFVELARRLPLGAVIWRYDPIVLGPAFPAAEHERRFAAIARALAGHTERVVISVITMYRKTRARMGALHAWETELTRAPNDDPALPGLLRRLVAIAGDHGMRVEACAQLEDYRGLGIEPTRCIDPVLLERLFGGRWVMRKDPGQRAACRCIPSRDIGMPDSCTLGCAYCYATRTDEIARQRFHRHDRASLSLL